MDVNGLHHCFTATLDANPNIRREAELQLAEASRTPGFIGACLDIVQSQTQGSIQLSAVVYLKNKVVRNWEFEELNKSTVISEIEKPAFRERLIPAIIESSSQTRQHLISVLNKVIAYDYPEKWPTFLDSTLQLLHSSDVQHVYAGLICLNEITKAYHWRTHEVRLTLDRVLELAFPIALQIAGSLLADNSTAAGDMMRLIVKSYRSAIYTELSPRLQDPTSLLPWGNLLLQIVSKELPQSEMPEDPSDREAHPWWKTKKWSVRNLNRLFTRYGDPVGLTDSMQEYKEFSKSFVVNFAPEILRAYLHQIELWVGGTYLSQPALNCILEYFEQCVRTKITWEILKPHTESLISQVIFPLLCLTDDDIDTFESDPIEYIHRRIDIYDESATPDIAATNFLVTLVERRRKATFNIGLGFINNIVVSQQQNLSDEKAARQKEGALRMMGGLSHIILGKNSPVAGMMEQFFVSYVFPDFQSPFGFLRVRACEIMNRFSEAQFNDVNNINIIYASITSCLNDKYLPVQVEAALALQPFARHDVIREAISRNIKDTMAKLMELTKLIDMDSLLGVMEDFVDMFSSQLAPFAVGLAEQLRDQFLHILSEVIEKENVDADSYDVSLQYSDLDDKQMAALGIINTLGTLLLSLDHSPELVASIEHTILPVIFVVLENEQADFYGEVLELIDSSSYCLKRISPGLWELFGLIHRKFLASAYDYFEELLPVLENYITYGKEEMVANKQYISAMVDIANRVLTTNDGFSGDTGGPACRLIQTLLLNLRGSMDEYIPYVVGIALQRLKEDITEESSSGYLVSLIEVIINCLYYNPVLAFQALEDAGQTANFFNIWFSNINKLVRVHDKKLSILAILSVISLPDEQIPASIMPGLPQLLHGMFQLLRTLPDALKKKEELSKEFESSGESLYDGSNLGNTGDWDDEVDEEGDLEDPESAAYLDFLTKEAERLGSKKDSYGDEDDEYDELEEEPLYLSPLDDIEANEAFKVAFVALQQNNSRNELLSQMTAEERNFVQSLMQA
ncbi:armadillo-type protein [Lipomyces arxii]|uniref:armadillo-type protein n=1 Tax=Lipomyces arxii TaxID=56418 RepID=UPI0034CEB054